jgi:2'-hydroxyisoflavone reductase
MKILVLGGTRFLGRHLVEELTARDHDVTCFHRGQTALGLRDEVRERIGDRNVDFGAVASERWDAIVDTCCARPEQIERSLELLADRYLLISTLNVYRDLAPGGVSEESPIIEEFDASDEAVSYGGNKAACERLLIRRLPKRSVILRPGLIVGKWDYTGRFTYWCKRFLRGGSVLAPAPPGRRVQFVDAADVARFAVRLIESDAAGTFNVVGPALPTTMVQLLDECARVAAERNAPPSRVVWAEEAFLLENGVQPWLELPLWPGDPDYAGMGEVSNAKAIAAGFDSTPTAQTIRSVLDFESNFSALRRPGLSERRELEVLESWSAQRG